MGLVTGHIDTVTIPHDPEHSVVIRKLSWLQLERASDARSSRAIEKAKQLGGELMTAMREAVAPDQIKALEEAAKDPLTAYDMTTVLREGIVSWSYGEYQLGMSDHLDEETAPWLARAIIKFSRPSKADEKNA